MKFITILSLLAAVCSVALGQGFFFTPWRPQEEQQQQQGPPGLGNWFQQIQNLMNPNGNQQRGPWWSFLTPQNNNRTQQQRQPANSQTARLANNGFGTTTTAAQ